MVQHISYDTVAVVSCPDCLDACCTCGHEGLEANWHLTPCPIKVEHLEELAERRERTSLDDVAGIFADAPEPTHCDECGQTLPKPKPAARQPHPATMAGRK
jgi:hypothetical protein